MEQVLAHGTPGERQHPEDPEPDDLDLFVPYLEGPDGHDLMDQLARLP